VGVLDQKSRLSLQERVTTVKFGIEEFEVLLLSPGSATVFGIAESSAMELDIFEGRVIRCDGDVCSYFEYEWK